MVCSFHALVATARRKRKLFTRLSYGCPPRVRDIADERRKKRIEPVRN